MLDLVRLRFLTGMRPSRRPRSPSSNHNVKELLFGANFHLAREATPPARLGPAGGVGAVYMGVTLGRQPQKADLAKLFCATFSAPVDNVKTPHFQVFASFADTSPRW